MSDVNPVALPTVRRLPLMLRHIQEHIAAGDGYISSSLLAKELLMDPILVRKALAATGVVGVPRLGFPARELERSILAFLGWDSMTDAVLCGVGNMGRALLGYQGFQQYGLRIVAAFDIDPALVGKRINRIEVYPVRRMKQLIERMAVRIGIVTVPADVAQSVVDAMIGAGIRGVWNFTPFKLIVPDGVVVQRVDLASSLAVLSHQLAMTGAKQ
ncbi:MAG: redox-sensing transcriptional repressor Rex [Kiritimatiellae bacterium]|nr:redox-sensing transcriptional repressor Rex [Kiritimatiellia bacterium]